VCVARRGRDGAANSQTMAVAVAVDVIVDVDVDVDANVILAVHVNGNAPVGVIEHVQGSMSDPGPVKLCNHKHG
jgi:hypothetical protein